MLNKKELLYLLDVLVDDGDINRNGLTKCNILWKLRKQLKKIEDKESQNE